MLTNEDAGAGTSAAQARAKVSKKPRSSKEPVQNPLDLVDRIARRKMETSERAISRFGEAIRADGSANLGISYNSQVLFSVHNVNRNQTRNGGGAISAVGSSTLSNPAVRVAASSVISRDQLIAIRNATTEILRHMDENDVPVSSSPLKVSERITVAAGKQQVEKLHNMKKRFSRTQTEEQIDASVGSAGIQEDHGPLLYDDDDEA